MTTLVNEHREDSQTSLQGHSNLEVDEISGVGELHELEHETPELEHELPELGPSVEVD